MKPTTTLTNGTSSVGRFLECTVNRVGDKYQDQVKRSGHQDRLTDLELIADLGIRTLRYPMLWERAAPYHPDELDWTWTPAYCTGVDTACFRRSAFRSKLL